MSREGRKLCTMRLARWLSAQDKQGRCIVVVELSENMLLLLLVHNGHDPGLLPALPKRLPVDAIL